MDPICKLKTHILVAGDEFRGGTGKRQREEGKQEATGAVDSWTQESGGWGRDGNGGRETDICKLSACARFPKILHKMSPIQERMERKEREGPRAGM